MAADTVAWETVHGLAAYVTDLSVWDDSVVDRLQCASLEVPLNYADPGGRHRRTRAQPGPGDRPGCAGPVRQSRRARRRGAQYGGHRRVGPRAGRHGVGIDLRGTGYSTAVDCALPRRAGHPSDDGSLAAYADAIAAAHRDCVEPTRSSSVH
ncbi:hypothetical protein GS416_05410 [Rhodococcus hoagii]|nr:hypothetical protein [Prescottella equi]